MSKNFYYSYWSNLFSRLNHPYSFNIKLLFPILLIILVDLWNLSNWPTFSWIIWPHNVFPLTGKYMKLILYASLWMHFFIQRDLLFVWQHDREEESVFVTYFLENCSVVRCSNSLFGQLIICMLLQNVRLDKIKPYISDYWPNTVRLWL